MKTSPRHAFYLFPALLLSCFLALLGSCFPALAQTPEALLEQLDAPDYAVRRDATESLLRDEALTAEQIAGWAADAQTLESRHRLRRIARHHFLRRLRLEKFGAEGPGSIGVVQSVQAAPPPLENTPELVPNANPDAVPEAGPAAGHPLLHRPGQAFALVTRVLPGFPAAGRLRVMDRIVALNGTPLAGRGNAPGFEDLMRRHRANQRLTLTVQRDQQTLDVEIPLTNGLALSAMYGFPEFALTDDFGLAWTQFLQTHPVLRDQADAADPGDALPNP